MYVWKDDLVEALRKTCLLGKAKAYPHLFASSIVQTSNSDAWYGAFFFPIGGLGTCRIRKS